MNYTLSDLIDTAKLQSLLDTLDKIHSLPTAIIDTAGNILTATAWQDLCTKFHRANPETERKCVQSDSYVAGQLEKSISNVIYKCPFGLVDTATPIIVEGQHLGNVFTGQLFTEPPDQERFLQQAQEYGFVVDDYLDAMRKVPIISEHRLRLNLDFLSQFTGILATQSLLHKRQLDTEAALRASAEQHSTIIRTALDGFWVVNVQGRLLEVNEAYCRMSGYSESQLLTMHISNLEAVENPGETAAHLKTIMAKGADRFESRHRRKDGSIFEVEVNVQQLSTGNDRLVVFVQDTTKRKAAESQIQSLAFSDPLTALPNRRLLLDRLQQALAGSGRQQRQGALMLVDLDNFKDINDVLGHAQGDLVLQQVATRLGACVRERDTVARVGADEFAVLLADLDENQLEAAMQAETVAHKILDALKQPYQLDGSEVSCTGSIGITLFGEHNDDNVEALKRAEMAMYQAKTQGRNTLRFFDPKMQAVVNARVSMESSLRDAVAHDQLELHYQAQVTDQGQITGAEALLRWLDPKRGVVSPAEFIPLAEETGLILPIGNWVLETACRQLAQWASQPGMAHLTVAVNVSAKQFHQRDFVDRVLMTLERTGANPHRLKLELTESLLVADVEGVIVKMNALKAAGVAFSLDDFGTGYSSLSYLQRLPLDQLKIDQGFIRDILINRNDAAIAKMVVALADSLGLTVIPEGVETEAQREFLMNLGCRHFQGYLFSKPLPIDELEAFVKRG